jgi:hypothetical protein
MIKGTCSECGGAVEVPEFWGGKLPPLGTCVNCGAVERRNYGPTVPMKPRRTGEELDRLADLIRRT